MRGRITAVSITAHVSFVLSNASRRVLLEFYPAVQIPANTYPWQKQAINTVAVKAVMISYDFRGSNCENVGKVSKIVYDNIEWLRANGHPKWKTVDLNAPLKGWEQYDCVTKVVQPSKRRAPEKPRVVNPVMDAIKKMFQE